MRISPLTKDQLPENMVEDLEYAETLMGFLPNDALTMARWPAFANAVKQLIEVVYAPGTVDTGLKRLIATVVSNASGCRYCQAHTLHGAIMMSGEDKEKTEQVWEFQTCGLFSEAERSALELARASGMQPNEVTDDHFNTLRTYFSEQQIMEIMGVISLFGLLNRWNDTLKTELEPQPGAFLK